MRVVVCDPGMGNVRSVARAIERAAGANARTCEVVVTRDVAAVAGADYVVVPGQGAFGPFAAGVESGLGDAVREHIAKDRPYLGICLGMQVLFESSDEAPGALGLGVLGGHVKRLEPGIDPATSRPYALPHIGWNSVTMTNEASLPDAPLRHFYFAHSFAPVPADATVIAGTTEYGAERFTSAVARGAIMGVQFHPEKSQREGIELLTRFFHV
ncbi:MAG: Imidazole glycerol phosphate synthase amidotransferase subunit [Labilithrix sp.]|nr:Imidazole glycerol phosphate synthase amidotransferase subunit [Labilithrix sp.]